MESIDPECTSLKLKYESCFNSWYSDKFLKGDITDGCANLFQEYRECIEKTLKVKKIDLLIEEHRKSAQRVHQNDDSN